jgi:hypothetical protein
LTSTVLCAIFRHHNLILVLPLAGAPKEKRAPSAYNNFMKTEVEKVKKANPSLKPAEAFKAAALNVKHICSNLPNVLIKLFIVEKLSPEPQEGLNSSPILRTQFV